MSESMIVVNICNTPIVWKWNTRAERVWDTTVTAPREQRADCDWFSLTHMLDWSEIFRSEYLEVQLFRFIDSSGRIRIISRVITAKYRRRIHQPSLVKYCLLKKSAFRQAVESRSQAKNCAGAPIFSSWPGQVFCNVLCRGAQVRVSQLSPAWLCAWENKRKFMK